MKDDAGIVRIRRELERLAGDRGWVNGSRLVQRLADALAIPHLDVRQTLLALAHAGVVDKIGPTGDGLGRVTILQHLPEQPTLMSQHERDWRDLVASQTLDPAVRAALSDSGMALVGL
jgi:hypothetical protein